MNKLILKKFESAVCSITLNIYTYFVSKMYEILMFQEMGLMPKNRCSETGSNETQLLVIIDQHAQVTWLKLKTNTFNYISSIWNI